MSVRSVIKRGVELLAVRSGMVSRRLRREGPSVVILAYHNVVPSGEVPAGDLGLHVSQERFGLHLDLLTETHDVVGLAEAFDDRVTEDRPRAVLTFDDAYQGAITVGLEETSRRGLPATVFVPPGLLGGAGFWWDLLAGRDGLEEVVREHALRSLQGRQERVLEWAAAEGLRRSTLPQHARPASASQLLASVRSYSSVTLGSHTWSHPNLAAISSNEARGEIERGHQWVRESDAPHVEWLAYPYGLWDDTSCAIAGDVTEGAVLVEGGLALRRGRFVSPKHAVPRVNAPSGLSVHGLALRLAGLR